MAKKTYTWTKFDALLKLLDAVEASRADNVIVGELTVGDFSAEWNNTDITIDLAPEG